MGWIMRKAAMLSGETLSAFHDPETHEWKAWVRNVGGEMAYCTILDENKEFLFTNFLGEKVRAKAYYKKDSDNKVIVEELTRYELKPPKFHTIEKYFDEKDTNMVILKFECEKIVMVRKFKRTSNEPGFTPKILAQLKEAEEKRLQESKKEETEK